MTTQPDLGRRLITGGIEVTGADVPGEGRQRIWDLTQDPTAEKFATVGFSTSFTLSGLNFIIDGGGSVITTGIKGDLLMPFGTRIFDAFLLADQSGSIKIDIWRQSFSDYPPEDANTITGGNEPEISSAVKWSSDELSGGLVNWERDLKALDTLRINVDSVTTITRVTLALVFINDIEFVPIRERVTS